MIIVEKNEGTKIAYEVTNTKICFADELMINLAKIQKDEPVHKDICYDADGDLVIGAEIGKYYVAEIDIPAIEYVVEESEVATQSEEESGSMNSSVNMIPQPLDMDKVVLTLWSIDDKEKVQEV